MKNREQEYKQIFITETTEEFDRIGTLIVDLEKDPDKKPVINEIFRLLHNLKANAKAMGFNTLSETAHKMETIFNQLRDGNLTFKGTIINFIYKGIDYIGYLIKNLDDPKAQEADPRILNELEMISSNKIDELSSEGVKASGSQQLTITDSVSIPLRRLDDLLNLVGELIIEREQLVGLANTTNNDVLKNIGSRLHRIADEIQQNVMAARLVSVVALFNKFPRIVRDIAVSENKKVDLKLSGHETKVDRNILSIITDTILHLIRNAISHGIEAPEERVKLGKHPEGTLTIIASSEKGHINLIIKDDGRGIDTKKLRQKAIEKNIISEKAAENISERQVLTLIFHPGLSLAEKITEFSGRGVGLDIVKNVIDSIGGDVKIFSEVNKGTSFQLSLPISIAVKNSLLFKVRNSNFALPLLNIDSVVNLKNNQIHELDGNLVMTFKGETVSLIYLNDFLFESSSILVGKANIQRDNIDVILLTYGNRKFGLIIDELIRQQEVVIKPLQGPVSQHDLFSGITVLGSGEVCFVLDISTIVKYIELEDVI
jgi:two-component system chemotaxis sensor kinase CheA